MQSFAEKLTALILSKSAKNATIKCLRKPIFFHDFDIHDLWAAHWDLNHSSASAQFRISWRRAAITNLEKKSVAAVMSGAVDNIVPQLQPLSLL